MTDLPTKGPGWTALHRAGYFNATYPRLCAKIQSAMRSHPQMYISPQVKLSVRCAEFLGALQAELHRVAAAGGGDRCKLPRAEHTRLAQSLTQVVSRGCRLMCALNALLAEFIAYKCAHVYDICGVT